MGRGGGQQAFLSWYCAIETVKTVVAKLAVVLANELMVCGQAVSFFGCSN